MTKKIFRSIFLAAMAVLLACLVMVMGVLYGYYGSVQEEQLKIELALASEGLERAGIDYLKGVQGCRLTWVSPDGDVLFDSQGDPSGMENHAQREEIQAAFQNGAGSSSRYSNTMTEQTIYYAKRLTDGSVLRVSVSRMTVFSLVIVMLQPLSVILLGALVFSYLFADRLSRKVVEPLGHIDLDKPLENDAYDELAPVLTRLEQQRRQIQRQTDEIREREREFLAVTSNMSEGLVLLNAKGQILSINPAAADFFYASVEDVGEDFLSLEREYEVSEMLETAQTAGHGEARISRNGREYQLRASRVGPDEAPAGIVLLVFDVTEKVFAERNRREFTANVSHELKTPLQSILGSAELMENGLVKTEDVPQFVGRIRSEADRLVALIDDIIRLSQLDERADLTEESFDFYELAKQEVDELLSAADEKRITLTLEGAAAPIQSVSQLCREIVFNLCDNAIKYNVDGGSVTVTVSPEGGGAALTVADTGIGIPAEHLDRIFERFYRVDKSHSRQIGGTGLGLSIVKHAVQDLDGSIAVKSEPGKGTIVTVTLP